ncbi:unnamed protein product [Moneuplotes crassus]|uniref:Pentatricopeptide repeat-containing protein n=2 Tax=Euplotes crassus TaxID=5936 RepID=A0AAD1XGI9_EUPCR|nr:unnamed protein product [Moneuplotes crassus]
MNSLIEAAEKKFDTTLSSGSRIKVAMRVLKVALFKRVLTSQEGCQADNSVMKYLEDTVSGLGDSCEQDQRVFINLLHVFYFENALRPTEDLTLLSGLIRATLKMKKNNDVKKLINIGLDKDFLTQENPDNEEETKLKSEFFETCSYAFNMTRNIDMATSLLRNVEQRSDMDFSLYLFNNIIECCMKCKKDHLAEGLLTEYTENVDSQIRSNHAILCTLITGYCKLNKVNEALGVYSSEFKTNDSDEETEKKYLTTSALNALLEGSVKIGNIAVAEFIFDHHAQAPGVIDISSVSILIKGYCNINSMEKAMALCDSIEKYAVEYDTLFFEYFLEGCANNSNIDMAFKILQMMKEKSITVSKLAYNSVIKACVSCRNMNRAWEVIEIMEGQGVKPDRYSYCFLIKGIKHYKQKNHLKRAFEIVFNWDPLEEIKEATKDHSKKPDYKYSKAKNQENHHYLYNVLLNACINCGDMDKALKLLEKMNQNGEGARPDEISYNTIIKGCAKARKLDIAFKIFSSMTESGLKPNEVTFNSMIDACVRCGKMDDAWDLFDQMKESDVSPDNFTYSTLIKGDQFKDPFFLERAFNLLNQIKERNEKPDEIVYNCLIDACFKHKDNRAFALFNEMQMANITPSSVTYGILIKAYGQENQLDNAFNAFIKMRELGLYPNDVTYGCLLDACIRNNNLTKAEEVFSSMQSDGAHMNTIIYTTMIKGYVKAHKLPEALKIYETMKSDENNMPNSITYNSLIDCCVRCNDMKKASFLFNEMKEWKVRPDLITFSTMIKGYCKDHSIQKAFQILKIMEKEKIKPDEVLFNSLLDGCFKANEIDLALTVYETMKSQKITPSNVTFSILVKIYGRSRQLSKALNILEEMKELRIKPGMIVYTCIIQTCIKAKQINTALEKFDEMKMHRIKPDYILYQTLLKGCIQFKKYDQGIQVLEDAICNNISPNREVTDPLFEGYLSRNSETRKQAVEKLKSKLKRGRFSQNKKAPQKYQKYQKPYQKNRDFAPNDQKKPQKGKDYQSFQKSKKPQSYQNWPKPALKSCQKPFVPSNKSWRTPVPASSHSVPYEESKTSQIKLKPTQRVFYPPSKPTSSYSKPMPIEDKENIHDAEILNKNSSSSIPESKVPQEAILSQRKVTSNNRSQRLQKEVLCNEETTKNPICGQ